MEKQIASDSTSVDTSFLIFATYQKQTLGDAGKEVIGGSRGRVRRTPPYGSRFFRFDTQDFRNVTASEVGAPYEVDAPLWKILDPPLGVVHVQTPNHL